MRPGRTVFHKQVDIDLLQGDAHAGTLQVGQHDEFDVCRRLVIVKLVLASGVGHETITGQPCSAISSLLTAVAESYLSSSPPSLRTIFRREKTVPKTSFASSSLAFTVCPSPIAPAWASVAREDLPTTEVGRGSQRRL